MVILLKKLKRHHRVVNVLNTSKLKSKSHDSWKQQWINETGVGWPERCSILDCHNDATDGAHVTTQGLFK